METWVLGSGDGLSTRSIPVPSTDYRPKACGHTSKSRYVNEIPVDNGYVPRHPNFSLILFVLIFLVGTYNSLCLDINVGPKL